MGDVIFRLRTMAQSYYNIRKVFDEIEADNGCSRILTDPEASRDLKIVAIYNGHIVNSGLPEDIQKQLLFQLPL